MYSLIVLTSLILTCHTTLSPLEALLICKYSGVNNFAVPCSDAVNACRYMDIECIAEAGASWNETIVSLTIRANFDEATSDALPTELGNLKSLQVFSFYTGNMLYNSTIPTQIALCTQLSSLRLVSSGLGGILPTELVSLQRLTYLLVAGTRLTGTIPTLNTPTLKTLIIALNNFSGSFPSIANVPLLEHMDISFNSFTGQLPDTSRLPMLQYYKVSMNQFYGSVPAFISPFLNTVDLSHNQLNGTFDTRPIFFTSNTTLVYRANGNELQGTIPSAFFTAALVRLDLSHNRLSGTISKQVILATNLEQLIFSHNLLSGSLAGEWQDGTFPALFRLSLDHNQLTGSIPSFTMLAQISGSTNYAPFIYINMNDNFLSGDIPLLGDFPSVASLDFSNNALTLAPTSFGSGKNVLWLNLAHNPIKTLPPFLFSDISTFRSLISLDLSFCQLTGTLPDKFHVQYIELNNNYFTGDVQSTFVYELDSTKLPIFADIRLNRLNTDATRQADTISLITEIILTDFPQDVDECLLNTHACEYLCIDGWFPVPGYTCDCPSGFQLDPVDKLNCSAVCGDGLLRYPEEACDYAYSLLGCHHDCTVKEGYLCDGTGCAPICGDGLVMPPEECDYNGSNVGCTAQCRAMDGFTCSKESNLCQTCAQEWVPFIYTPNLRLFPNLRRVIGEDLTDFKFASCIACDDGIALQTRTVLGTEQCINMNTTRSLACSFACPNLTVFSSAVESIYTLEQELMKNGFLQHVFRVIFNANVTINITSSSVKRVSDVNTQVMSFELLPCISDKTAMIDVIRALTLDIVPNLPNLALRESTKCAITLSATNPPLSSIISIVLVVSVAAACLVLVIFGSLIYYYRSSELHHLPDDISWSFLDQRLRPWAWQFNGNAKSGYYSRQYDRKSEDYRRVDSLLTTHLMKGNVQIESITAVYNPSLSSSFVNMWRVMITRKLQSCELFFARTYTRDVEKMKVMDYVDTQLLQFTPYNRDLVLPLIPVLHGTDYTTAECIAQTGFAALSSLDEGYYGKGIYFTTSLSYTLIYACAKRRPAVILSYINMGNPYPVTERHDGPKSFKGAAIKSGYNSHVVRTSKRGFIYQEADDVLCDEFVIPQESQILPAFIVELNLESCAKEHDKWTRVIPDPVPDAAIKAFHAEQEVLSLYQTPLDSVVSFDDHQLLSPHKQSFDI